MMPAPFPSIIAFCGQATAGKTTAACYVSANWPGFTRLSFADPIRDMLRALGLTDIELTACKHVPCDILLGKTPREGMQSLGTEWGRDLVHYDLWLHVMRRRIEGHLHQHHRVVIDDCRFDNEAALIQAMGGTLIRLSRPGLPAPMAHASEIGVSEGMIDCTVSAADVPALFAAIAAHLNAYRPAA